MEPIATMARLAGEVGYLLSPGAIKGYDPSQAADYAPNDPGVLKVIGIPDHRVDRLPTGAVATFTFAAQSKPVGLEAEASILKWRDTTWRVMRFRERTWRGKTSGFTLYLAA